MRYEQKFLTKLGNWFKDNGWHWFKIPDMPFSPESKQTRFNVSKPYDAYCHRAPHFLAIEAKHLNGFRTFGIPDLRDSQIKGLNDAQKSGGRSYVMLLISYQKIDKEKREKVSLDRCFIFPWEELKTKFTYSPNELRQYPFVINAKNSSYDLTSFVDSLNSKPFLN